MRGTQFAQLTLCLYGSTLLSQGRTQVSLLHFPLEEGSYLLKDIYYFHLIPLILMLALKAHGGL